MYLMFLLPDLMGINTPASLRLTPVLAASPFKTKLFDWVKDFY